MPESHIWDDNDTCDVAVQLVRVSYLQRQASMQEVQQVVVGAGGMCLVGVSLFSSLKGNEMLHACFCSQASKLS